MGAVRVKYIYHYAENSNTNYKFKEDKIMTYIILVLVVGFMIADKMEWKEEDKRA